MIRIDDEFMNEVGLGEMPVTEAQAFKEHAEEELEVRVGQEIGMRLSEAQLDEFASISDKAQATSWLEQNVPDFREIVLRIYQEFKQEIIAGRQQILA